MNSVQQSVNEQIQHISHLQSRALQPMRIFGGLAADTMEKVARKNYAVMGDFIEFSVKQVRLPLSGESAGDIFSAQIEQLGTFGEQMNSRASEYADLVSALTEQVKKATDDAAAQVREVADDAAEQTRQSVDKAVVSTQKAAEAAGEHAAHRADEVSNTVKKASDAASDNAKKVADSAEKVADDAKSSAAEVSKRTKKTGADA